MAEIFSKFSTDGFLVLIRDASEFFFQLSLFVPIDALSRPRPAPFMLLLASTNTLKCDLL